MASSWILLMTIGLQLFTGSICTVSDEPAFCSAEFVLKHIFLLVPSRDELPHLTRYLSLIRSVTIARNPDDDSLVHVMSDPEDREAIYRHTIERNVYVSHTPYCVPKTEFSALQEQRANRTLLEKLRGSNVLGNLIDREPATDDERTATKEQNGAMMRLLKNGRLPSFSRRFIRAADATPLGKQSNAAEPSPGHVMAAATNGIAARVARYQMRASAESAPHSRLVKRQDDDVVTTPVTTTVDITATEGAGPTLTPPPPPPPPPPLPNRSNQNQGKGKWQGGKRDGVRNPQSAVKSQKSHVHGNQKRTTSLPESLKARGKVSNRKSPNREEGKSRGIGHKQGAQGKHVVPPSDEDDANRSADELVNDIGLSTDAVPWLIQCIAEAPDTNHNLSDHLYKMFRYAKRMENQKRKG
ncbi:uncharacterized protein LOC124177618 [Neodiprion fabricii]|uniref:uncharacterized protein LOC124177618 n=1 Tax=Neodiprion fabricii TaxID=2872261 RepID=UPI001ED91818|nr:uncharacterized protein LOC124177618 [Neodiprion fabricii]